MPLLVGALAKAFLWAMGFFLGRLIIGFGIGFVAYKGVEAISTTLFQKMLEVSTSGEGAGMFALAADALGFWDAIYIIISAYAARLGTGTVYKLAFRKAAAG